MASLQISSHLSELERSGLLFIWFLESSAAFVATTDLPYLVFLSLLFVQYISLVLPTAKLDLIKVTIRKKNLMVICSVEWVCVFFFFFRGG